MSRPASMRRAHRRAQTARLGLGEMAMQAIGVDRQQFAAWRGEIAQSLRQRYFRDERAERFAAARAFPLKTRAVSS